MPPIPAKVTQAHRVRGSKRRGRNLSVLFHAKLLVSADRLASFIASPLPVEPRRSK